MINYLSEKFKCKAGYSGHEKGGLVTSIAAVTLGATSLERHITLENNVWFRSICIYNYGGICGFNPICEKIELALKFKNKTILDLEKPVAEKLRNNIDNLI